jgi:hypothetical protein
VLWLQDVWHFGTVPIGLAIAPGPAVVPLVALGTGRLIRRFGPGLVATAGNLVFAAGLGRRAEVVHSGPNYLPEFLPSMLLTGTGVGLTLPTLLSAATTAVPAPRVATGSAIVNTGRQIASGIAVLVTLLGTHAVGDSAPEIYKRAWLISAAIMVVASLASIAVRRPALAQGERGGGQSPHIDDPDNELVTT